MSAIRPQTKPTLRNARMTRPASFWGRIDEQNNDS